MQQIHNLVVAAVEDGRRIGQVFPRLGLRRNFFRLNHLGLYRNNHRNRRRGIEKAHEELIRDIKNDKGTGTGNDVKHLAFGVDLLQLDFAAPRQQIFKLGVQGVFYIPFRRCNLQFPVRHHQHAHKLLFGVFFGKVKHIAVRQDNVIAHADIPPAVRNFENGDK